ncbi:unnamed protein product [Thelazia callipaeda]|uniref:C2H2-type domain-containing protein n=1 Tax=Thelazia callipaeda TaxID=103827 RepID=A0A0N5CW56_THECL|nr:unnamed protein product [Thelazia callipaeda]
MSHIGPHLLSVPINDRLSTVCIEFAGKFLAGIVNFERKANVVIRRINVLMEDERVEDNDSEFTNEIQSASVTTENVDADICSAEEIIELFVIHDILKVEETELVEESTLGQVIIGNDGEYYVLLTVNAPDIDFERIENVQILKNDDGTETLLLEIDEISESSHSCGQEGKRGSSTYTVYYLIIFNVYLQEDQYQSEITEVEKNGRIMQQLFGNCSSYDASQVGRYRRNRVYGTYSCPECDQTFINTARLERHLAVHQVCGSFQCPLCHKVYKYEYNLFYHWRRTCHDLNELVPAERRRLMDVNILRKMVLKQAQKKAEETPPPVMKIGINPNLLFKSDSFNLFDMQAPIGSQSSVYSGVPCKYCGVKIPSFVMQWHVAVHRGIIAVDTRSGSGEHFCSLCGLLFRQHYSLIKHWRSGCNEIQARLPDTRDISMDDETLKDMVSDIMRELSEEYLQRFSGVSLEDEEVVSLSQDIFIPADKEKKSSGIGSDQDINLFPSHEILTSGDSGEIDIVATEELHSSWNYLDQVSGDSINSNEANPVRTKWSSSHGMVQCSICSRTFVNISRLEKHIAGFHTTSGSHPCILCGNRFKYDYNLLSHYRRACPYTKLYIDAEKREQMDAPTLRRAVRILAQKNLHLTSSQKRMIADRCGLADSSLIAAPYFRIRPPLELMVMRPDLPNGKSCPLCGVIFYGESAVERHMKAVHPSEVSRYVLSEKKKILQAAPSIKDHSSEGDSKLENLSKEKDEIDSADFPPTLAPEVPVQESVTASKPAIRRVCRVDEDVDGNQIFFDENDEVIELEEDEEVQIEFDDMDSIQHLIETGQLAIENEEESLVLTRDVSCSYFIKLSPHSNYSVFLLFGYKLNCIAFTMLIKVVVKHFLEIRLKIYKQDPKYCYNANYGASSSTCLFTENVHLMDNEKFVTHIKNRQTRKHKYDESSLHYG